MMIHLPARLDSMIAPALPRSILDLISRFVGFRSELREVKKESRQTSLLSSVLFGVVKFLGLMQATYDHCGFAS